MIPTKRRGIFGAPIDPAGPPISPDRGASPDAAPVTVDAAIPGYKKPSTAQMIAGVIGDTLTNFGGGRGFFLPQLAQQREYAQQAAVAQQNRAQEFADWQRKQQWERDNPAPINNDTVADYNFRSETLGKEAADEWLRNASDPIVTVTLPGNRVYSGPRSGLAAALGGGAGGSPAPAVPQAPVGKLTPITGGAGSGPRTFP